jgi:hypothetical protein
MNRLNRQSLLSIFEQQSLDIVKTYVFVFFIEQKIEIDIVIGALMNTLLSWRLDDDDDHKRVTRNKFKSA